MFVKNLIAVIGLTFSLGASAGPILNGDFEAGLNGWTATNNVYLATENGGAFWFGAGSTAQNGTGAVAFNAGDSTPNGAIAQSFATSAGTRYDVTFDFGASRCQFSCGQSVLASALGSDGLATLASLQVQGLSSGALATYGFSFIASGNQTTLRFSDLASNDTTWLDGVLDNVDVQAVPEPGSLALLALGLFGLGALRRRK